MSQELAYATARRAAAWLAANNGTGPGQHHVNYRAVVDLGYGRVDVAGLDRDRTSFDRNMAVLDLAEVIRG